MYKVASILTGIILLALPACVFAACSTNGATVVYVNGVETTKEEADNDTAVLRRTFQQYGGSPDVQLITGYNPSHLGGLGDAVESISQEIGTPISEYDLDTILMQVAPDVTTRRMLLLGYSQGSFYANEMYDFLVTHGVPADSIAVYNIATPASVVEGGGTYLTSADDKLVNQVRVWDAEAGLSQPLPANILIPPQSGDASDTYGGHHFVSDYLAGAGSRIVSDIDAALANRIGSAGSGPCIMPPTLGLSDEVQQALFSVADPTVGGADYTAADAKYTLASVMQNANDILHTAFSDAIFSIFPKPDADSAGAVFSVEKALYGSSLSESDYEALLNGQNPEEVVTAPPAPSQQKPSDQVTPPEPANPPAVPQENLQPTTSSSEISQVSSTTIISIPPTVIISPGFGGGEPVSAPQADASPASTQSDASSSQDQLASAQATSTPPIPPAASSTETDEISTTTVAVASTTSPVTDSFDSGFSGWSNYASGWSASVWSTSTSDCYSGNCLSEITFDQQYENIKKGTALTAGAFVLYFRNDGYTGGFGEGVCTDDVGNECQDFSRIGGADALIATHSNAFHDNAWHYLYFAFRDGAADKEYCDMVDDNAPSDCNWQSSPIPNGTLYSDVLFFTSNGLNSGTSFYWDELGLAPHPPTGP